MKKTLMFLFALFLVNSYLFAQAEITSSLSTAISTAQKTGTTVKAIIVLDNQYDVSALDKQLSENKTGLQDRAFMVITELQKHAARTQENLVNLLESKSKSEVPHYQKFWIANIIAVTAQPDILLDLAKRDDISQMDLDGGLQLIKPVEKRAAVSSPNGAEPGLKVINAHKLWQMGITGKDVIVMNLDTGVDGTHPALASRWRGNDPGVPASAAWFDPSEGSSFPIDPGPSPGGHGTHTMGTITGLDIATNDTIGVAFEAKWIAVRSLFLLASDILRGFQWALDPDGHPDTYNDMPTVISNSWGWGWQCTPFYHEVIDVLEAAGIALVFAAGNSGPALGTVITPAMINETEMNVFSVGALNGNLPQLPIAEFSSRGPTFCTGLGNQIKPEVSAPGVDVRSSVPNGGYEYWSGTSMATPHVAGAIALLKQVFPGKTGTELKQMLYENAADLGVIGEDNTYGMGVIDVYAALLANISIANPMPPANVTAYSDYQTPTSALISWDDPVSSVGGNSLINFEIEVWRNNQFITSIGQGVGNHTDTQLSDGQQYEYKIYTHDLTSDSLSDAAILSVYAGGSPFPSPPTNLSCQVEGDSVLLQWTDPTTQTDGTPLDDLDKIVLYSNGDSIARIQPGVENITDYPLPGSTVFYTLQAVDDEMPPHRSVFCDSFECFVGTIPDYLVWVGTGSVISTIASAESIFYAIAANGESVFLTDDLFEFGNDLSVLKGIFVVLGQYDHCRFLELNDPEPQALESYLLNGGRLYLEGGVCFNVDPANPDDPRYDIKPWFSLAFTNAYTNSLLGIQGLDYFSNFSFGYNGLSYVLEELLPINSTPIWENSNTGAICGVWNVGSGSGLAIGVVPCFGDLVNSSNGVTSRRNQSSPLTEKFSFADIRMPDNLKNENRTKFIKRFAHKPELQTQRKRPYQLLKFSSNGTQILANTKIDLMAAYLTLLQLSPAHAIYGKTNSSYFTPGTDTVWITSKIVNPNTQQISVHAIIEYLNHTTVDSISMFDDGLHNDSTAGDGIYGGPWPTLNEEKTYSIKIQTYSDSLGINHFLNNAAVFTTVGPLAFDSYQVQQIFQLISGYRAYVNISVRNNGLVSPADEVEVELLTEDPTVVSIGNARQSFGEILPGQVGTPPEPYSIRTNTKPQIDTILFRLNIYNYGNLYWQDSTVSVIVGLENVNNSIPCKYELKQNFPNPFNPTTAIEFGLPMPSHVHIVIYDLLGRHIKTLLDVEQPAGHFQLIWDGTDVSDKPVASGLYFCRMEAGNFVKVIKLELLK